VKHRASAKFWSFFGQLPTEIQTLARENYDLLKETHVIHRCISKKLGVSGLSESAFIIVPLPSKNMMTWFGSGLVITACMIN
jgi:hypothetical protein